MKIKRFAALLLPLFFLVGCVGNATNGGNGTSNSVKPPNSTPDNTTEPVAPPKPEPTNVIELMCDHRYNPLGTDDKAPFLSWKLNFKEKGQKQTAFRIVVSSSKEKFDKKEYDMWDYLSYSSTSSINYAGKPLEPSTKYYWTVYVSDKDGKENLPAEPTFFDTGLFGDFGNDNKWISESKRSSRKYAARLFRKSFETNKAKEIEKARLYVTSAGCHEMYLNGKRCSDDYFAPGKHEYNQILYYQTYDVTSYVNKGKNTIAAQLGMGWYNGGPIGSNYGTDLGLKAKLVITYNDGTQSVVNTDSSWICTTEGPVTTNRFYIGQYIDGRKNIENWNTNDLKVDNKIWSNCEESTTFGKISTNLVAENTNPVRVIDEMHPVRVTNPKKGVYVYTFKTNIVGTIKVTAKGDKGDTISFKYAEMLTNDGYADISTFLANNQNGADKYTFAGTGKETFTFSLVYHGFQYVEIRGLSEAIPLEDITALVLSTDNTRTGYFKCSNSLLTSFFDNVIRSQQGNFIGAITDCPTREKNNWTGDAAGFATAANYNFNSYNIYRSFHEMVLHAQSPTGEVPEVVPLTERLPANPTTKTPSGWSDCVITIPYQMYFQYGDVSFLEDSYDAMKLWADYLIRTCKGNGYVRSEGWYGDNVPIDWRMYITDTNKAPIGEIGTAYSAYSIGLLADIAEILGNKADMTYYRAESNKFAKAWRKNYLEADGITCKMNSQTSYAMGIYYDLYETQEKRKAASDKLAALIMAGFKDEATGTDIPAGAQSVGFIGYPILYYTLSDFGNTDVVYTLLERTAYPSILYPVNRGATTTWEYYSRVCSLNHFFSGCVSSWLYSEMLGISHEYDVNNAGYGHFVLKPTPGGKLKSAEGSYNSINGEIKSKWKLDKDGTFTFECTVPANTSATLKLPASETSVITEGGKNILDSEGITFVGYEDGRMIYEIVSGEYSFEVKNA